MKFAFTGKGGSGKTTISSLFSQLAAEDGHDVLVLDADINQHLAEALGYTGKLRSMGTEADAIKTYLLGTNKQVNASSMHKTTPPRTGSNLIRLNANDWFIREFAQKVNDNLYIAGAGDIPDGNVGVRCYHGLNGAVELLLGHMIDEHDDVVIVDMTAGADAFSSSLFTKVDVLVLVVEPALKSLRVYEQFKKYAADYDMPVVVVANKIQDERDKAFVLEHVDSVSAWIEVSTEVKQRERGEAHHPIEAEAVNQLRSLRKELLSRPIDWKRREELAIRMHKRAVDHPQIDETFSLAREAL